MKPENLLAVLALIAIPVVSVGQGKLHNCDRITNGKFYYRYADARTRINVFRNGKVQYEVNETTKDTTWLKLDWLDGCSYNMTFVRRTKPFDEGEEALTRSMLIHVAIIGMAERYYITQGTATSSLSPETISGTDTLWFR